MNIIAIDCGASYVKSALFRNGEKILSLRAAAPPVETDFLRHDHADDLFQIVKEHIDTLSESLSEYVLCMSNEMHGFILVNAEGTPVIDYISWQQEYGNVSKEGVSAREILGAASFEEDILHTGMPLRGGLPSCNLLFLKRSESLTLSTSKLIFLTLGDYLLRRYSGQEIPTHRTNAAATGLYDLGADAWNERLCLAVGSDGVFFPEISETPIYCSINGKKVTILPAIGDQQAALLGAGFIKHGQLSFNIGTGAQVSLLCDKPVWSNSIQCRPYFYGKYIRTIPHIPSGRAMNVYFRFFKDILSTFEVSCSDEYIWEKLLNSTSGSVPHSMKTDLSFFDNAITKNTKGSLTDIGEYDLTVSNLMETLIDQMAENFVAAEHQLQADCNKDTDEVIFSGGVARKVKELREKIISKSGFQGPVSVATDETMAGLRTYAEKMLISERDA